MFPSSKGARKKAGQQILAGNLDAVAVWNAKIVERVTARRLMMHYEMTEEDGLTCILIFRPTLEIERAISQHANNAMAVYRDRKVRFGPHIIAHLLPAKHSIPNHEHSENHPNLYPLRMADFIQEGEAVDNPKAKFRHEIQMYESLDEGFHEGLMEMIERLPSPELPLEQTEITI